MKKEKTYQESFRRTVILITGAVVITAILLEVFVLIKVNKKHAERTTEVLIQQVVNVLERNTVDEAEMISSMKEDYIVRTEAIAYILDSSPEARTNINELQRIAQLMGVDEIHLFDNKGKIYSGTVEKYYGISMDSGEQIAYFLPMLEDKSLKMCQDVTPNTAENKNMMYAMVWNKSGEYMVQVGVEPVRLMENLERNSIKSSVANMPSYEGLDIYVADIETGVIEGASNEKTIGLTLDEIGFPKKEVDLENILSEDIILNNYLCYCKFLKTGNHVVVVTYSTVSNVENFFVTIGIEIVYMLCACVFIYIMASRLLKSDKDREKQLAILVSMADIYYSMHLIDLESNTIREYRANEMLKEVMDPTDGADVMMQKVMKAASNSMSHESILAFTDLHTLPDRMQHQKMITKEFLGLSLKWFRASFISIEEDVNGRPVKVIYTTRCIDDEKKKEEILIHRSNTDELTGLYNRRAYEDDMAIYKGNELADNFIYITADVNGLKVVNDNLGHEAGDELLVGASLCLKKCLGGYGKLYRTGGDEFVSIIFANEDEFEDIKQDIEETVLDWKGDLVDSLSVSIGYVTKKEAKDLQLHQITVLADKRMYEEKSRYYQRKGVDRRGQKDAHIALCALYTKILKINITEDSYQIVNMDINEQTKDKGFSNKISEWLSNFGTTGQVHPEDLEEYLSKTNLAYMSSYFGRNKTSLNVFYRRKYGDVYKQVMMEIIPANDYSDDNQSLYLYVKNIDK